MASDSSQAYNLGNGNEFSLQEMVGAARSVTRGAIKVIDGPLRPIDRVRFVANARLASERLSWISKYTDLSSMVKHAWEWQIGRRSKY